MRTVKAEFTDLVGHEINDIYTKGNKNYILSSEITNLPILGDIS
jgi:hypothetical protein